MGTRVVLRVTETINFLQYKFSYFHCQFDCNNLFCSKNLIKDIKHYNKTFHRSASQEVKK